MKQDSQHLEFLISQYVDNVLDAPNRKFVEQELAADAEARELLKKHREAQDLLDDYGSRLPLIDWNDFDARLAARLDAESAAPRVAPWKRWIRPVAAAAALALAATLGYGWHAYERQTEIAQPTQGHPVPVVQPETHVTINDRPSLSGSIGRASVDEVAVPTTRQTATVDYPTGDPPTVGQPRNLPGSVTAGVTATQPDGVAEPR